MTSVRFDDLSLHYGPVAALQDVDLTIAGDRVAVLCGPPRSGKSTLLRLLVGLERPDRGRILIDGEDVTAWPPARRRVGYVPQSFALFPHMSVRENIAYPLRQRRVPGGEIAERVGRISDVLRIGHLLAHRPDQLSGGEKQRAAIARGTLQDARVFALDDPLVGLDFKLRESLMDELKDMRESLRATFVYATSDSLEALTMGDELAILEGGRLIETGPAERVYLSPSHVRSAELVGFPRCNVIAGKLENARCTTAFAGFALDSDAAEDGPVDVVVRPEHVVLAGPDAAPIGIIERVGQVVLIEHLGAECVVHVDVAGTRLVSTPPSDAVARLAAGADLRFRIRPESLVVFEGRSGNRLGRGMAVDG